MNTENIVHGKDFSYMLIKHYVSFQFELATYRNIDCHIYVWVTFKNSMVFQYENIIYFKIQHMYKTPMNEKTVV